MTQLSIKGYPVFEFTRLEAHSSVSLLFSLFIIIFIDDVKYLIVKCLSRTGAQVVLDNLGSLSVCVFHRKEFKHNCESLMQFDTIQYNIQYLNVTINLAKQA